MSNVAIDHPSAGAGAGNADGDFGVWTGCRIPDDRADWHPLVRRFYEYWLSVKPADRLPGRRHIVPEELAPLWSRLRLIDVHRDPLRYRYRYCGSAIVQSLGREVTGWWLDQAHPEIVTSQESAD